MHEITDDRRPPKHSSIREKFKKFMKQKNVAMRLWPPRAERRNVSFRSIHKRSLFVFLVCSLELDLSGANKKNFNLSLMCSDTWQTLRISFSFFFHSKNGGVVERPHLVLNSFFFFFFKFAFWTWPSQPQQPSPPPHSVNILTNKFVIIIETTEQTMRTIYEKIRV